MTRNLGRNRSNDEWADPVVPISHPDHSPGPVACYQESSAFAQGRRKLQLQAAILGLIDDTAAGKRSAGLVRAYSYVITGASSPGNPFIAN